MLDDRSYMRDESPTSAWGSGGGHTAWSILLVINVVAYVLQMLAPMRSPTEIPRYIEVLALWPDSLLQGHIWQLLTFQFLHDPFSPFHLIFNCLMLWLLGRFVEEHLGRRKFVILYILSGVCGGLLQVAYILLWNSIEPMSVIPFTVGASAGLYGLFAALAVITWQRTMQMMLFFVVPITMQGRVIFWFFAGTCLLGCVFAPFGMDRWVWIIPGLGIFLMGFWKHERGMMGAGAVILVLGLISGAGGVAHAGHLGGLLGGFFIILQQVALYDVAAPSWMSRFQFSLPEFRKRQKRRKVIKVGSARAFSGGEAEVMDAEETTSDDYISQEIDPILEKITKEGISSLSQEERELLDEARKRMR